jgi:hypothetical protein
LSVTAEVKLKNACSYIQILAKVIYEESKIAGKITIAKRL